MNQMEFVTTIGAIAHTMTGKKPTTIRSYGPHYGLAIWPKNGATRYFIGIGNKTL